VSCLGGQLAISVRAKGRKDEKFSASADANESLVLEPGVYAVTSVTIPGGNRALMLVAASEVV
jgi:hypothetical protein